MSTLALLLLAWLVVIPATVVAATLVGARVREQRVRGLFAGLLVPRARTCEARRAPAAVVSKRRGAACSPGRSLSRRA